MKFFINIMEASGNFEVIEGGSIAVSGKIYEPEDVSKETLELPKLSVGKDSTLPLLKADVYKDLRLRGYDYTGVFQGIHESENRGIHGKLAWDGNWISFIDTMLQFSILGQNTRELYLPTRLQRAVINPVKHLGKLTGKEYSPVYMYRDVNVCKSGGIELRGLKASLAPRRLQTQSAPKLEKYQFIPYENNQVFSDDPEKARYQTLTVLLQTVLENSTGALKLKVSEVAQERSPESLLSPVVVKVLESEPMMTVECTTMTQTETEPYLTVLEPSGIKVVQRDVTSNVDQNVHLIVAYNLLANKTINVFTNCIDSLKTAGMILLEEPRGAVDVNTIKKLGLDLVSKQTTDTHTYLLLRKPVDVPADSVTISVTENDYDWVNPLKTALVRSEKEGTKIYLVVQNEELTGGVGLMNCIMREPGGANARLVFVNDGEAFSLDSDLYSKQLSKDLVMNVLKNGVWGSYRHITLDHTVDSGKLQVEHAYINALTRGDLSSFKWIEGPLSFYK